jgi:aspartate oxidase
MEEKNGKRQGNSSNPESPVTTPSFGNSETWSLQAFVELKASIVRMESSIEHLCEKVTDIKKDTDRLSGRIEKLEHKMIAAAAIVTVAIIVGGFVANKAIDFGLEMAKEKIHEEKPAITAPTQPAK